MASEDDAAYLDLSLGTACLLCQSFTVHPLHHLEWGDEVVAVLPPSFGLDPSFPTEFRVEKAYKLSDNVEFTAPVSPGGIGLNECPAITCVTMSTLEADASECRLTMTDEGRIRFPSEDEAQSGDESDNNSGGPRDGGGSGNESPDSEVDQVMKRQGSYDGSASSGSDSKYDRLRDKVKEQLTRLNSRMGEGSGDTSNMGSTRVKIDAINFLSFESHIKSPHHMILSAHAQKPCNSRGRISQF